MMGGQGGMIADWIKSAADDTKRDQLTLYNMYDANRRENTRHDEWNTAMNVSTDLALNRYTHQVADLKRAGLNPMLAVSSGQPPSPGAGVSTSAPSSAGAANNQHGSSTNFGASAAAAAQASLVTAQADKLKAETDLLRKQGATEAERPGQVRAQVQESLQRAKTLMGTERREYASAAQATQAVENMKAELPRIEADIGRLRAVTQQSLQSAGLSEAQAKQVMQHVQQNLPEVEKALREFQVKLESLKVPGAQNAASVQESFFGVLSNYVRALIPINNLLR